METKKLIERWQDQVQHRSVATSEVRKIGNEMAELLAVTEAGYQQVCQKNDELQALTKRMTAAVNGIADERDRMQAALQEIDGWRDDTLGPRPKEPDQYNCPQVETAAFNRGTRMAFYRCSDRARAALAPVTNSKSAA